MTTTRQTTKGFKQTDEEEEPVLSTPEEGDIARALVRALNDYSREHQDDKISLRLRNVVLNCISNVSVP